MTQLSHERAEIGSNTTSVVALFRLLEWPSPRDRPDGSKAVVANAGMMRRHPTRSGAIPEKHWRVWAAAHLANSEALDNRMGVREAALNGIVENQVHGLLPFGLEAGMASALLGDRRESNVGTRDAAPAEAIKSTIRLQSKIVQKRLSPGQIRSRTVLRRAANNRAG